MSWAADAVRRRLDGLSTWRPVAAGRRVSRRAIAPRAEDAQARVRRVAVVQSDIVASTLLLEAAGSRYPGLLLRHRRLIAAAVARRGGRFLAHAGDGALAVFDRADGALLASVEAQRALRAEPWPEGLVPRVRMGVHVGDVYEVDGEPVGLPIHHGARIMAAARPGQVLVSAVAAAAAGDRDRRPPAGVALADAGWHELRDHCGAVRLQQVVADGLTVVTPDEERTLDLTAGRPDPAGVDRSTAADPPVVVDLTSHRSA
jgi:class 3 adenylate cyclase